MPLINERERLVHKLRAFAVGWVRGAAADGGDEPARATPRVHQPVAAGARPRSPLTKRVSADVLESRLARLHDAKGAEELHSLGSRGWKLAPVAGGE